MTNGEVVKQAIRVVAGLIRDKTPPISETCKRAHADLAELVQYTNSRYFEGDVDDVVAEGVQSIVARLEPFCAGVVKNRTEKKQLDEVAFAGYVKDQVEKSLSEESAPALRRLHALQTALTKASFENSSTVSIETYVDPFQQATLEIDPDGRRVTSGTANRDEVSVGGIGGTSVKDLQADNTTGSLMKAMVDSVEKDAKARLESNTGWAHDLTSKEFLFGERKHDFGRDGAK